MSEAKVSCLTTLADWCPKQTILFIIQSWQHCQRMVTWGRAKKIPAKELHPMGIEPKNS